MLPSMRAFHESEQKKIGVISRMISTKTYLHSPYAVFQNAKPFVYQECVEFIKAWSKAIGL